MQLLEDSLIAALAAVGLMTLLCALFSLLRPRRRTTEAVAVVPACGEAASLEQTVRALARDGKLSRVVILDCGMCEDARKVAELLCRDDRDVTICSHAALARELDAST